MQVEFVYRGNSFGNGILQQLPHTGDFFKINKDIFKVDAIMFEGAMNNVSVVIYLIDATIKEEERLKYF